MIIKKLYQLNEFANDNYAVLNLFNKIIKVTIIIKCDTVPCNVND